MSRSSRSDPTSPKFRRRVCTSSIRDIALTGAGQADGDGNHDQQHHYQQRARSQINVQQPGQILEWKSFGINLLFVGFQSVCHCARYVWSPQCDDEDDFDLYNVEFPADIVVWDFCCSRRAQRKLLSARTSVVRWLVAARRALQRNKWRAVLLSSVLLRALSWGVIPKTCRYLKRHGFPLLSRQARHKLDDSITSYYYSHRNSRNYLRNDLPNDLRSTCRWWPSFVCNELATNGRFYRGSPRDHLTRSLASPTKLSQQWIPNSGQRNKNDDYYLHFGFLQEYLEEFHDDTYGNIEDTSNSTQHDNQHNGSQQQPSLIPTYWDREAIAKSVHSLYSTTTTSYDKTKITKQLQQKHNQQHQQHQPKAQSLQQSLSCRTRIQSLLGDVDTKQTNSNSTVVGDTITENRSITSPQNKCQLISMSNNSRNKNDHSSPSLLWDSCNNIIWIMETPDENTFMSQKRWDSWIGSRNHYSNPMVGSGDSIVLGTWLFRHVNERDTQAMEREYVTGRGPPRPGVLIPRVNKDMILKDTIMISPSTTACQTLWIVTIPIVIEIDDGRLNSENDSVTNHSTRSANKENTASQTSTTSKTSKTSKTSTTSKTPHRKTKTIQLMEDYIRALASSIMFDETDRTIQPVLILSWPTNYKMHHHQHPARNNRQLQFIRYQHQRIRYYIQWIQQLPDLNVTLLVLPKKKTEPFASTYTTQKEQQSRSFYSGGWMNVYKWVTKYQLFNIQNTLTCRKYVFYTQPNVMFVNNITYHDFRYIKNILSAQQEHTQRKHRRRHKIQVSDHTQRYLLYVPSPKTKPIEYKNSNENDDTGQIVTSQIYTEDIVPTMKSTQIDTSVMLIDVFEMSHDMANFWKWYNSNNNHTHHHEYNTNDIDDEDYSNDVKDSFLKYYHEKFQVPNNQFYTPYNIDSLPRSWNVKVHQSVYDEIQVKTHTFSKSNKNPNGTSHSSTFQSHFYYPQSRRVSSFQHVKLVHYQSFEQVRQFAFCGDPIEQYSDDIESRNDTHFYSWIMSLLAGKNISSNNLPPSTKSSSTKNKTHVTSIVSSSSLFFSSYFQSTICACSQKISSHESDNNSNTNNLEFQIDDFGSIAYRLWQLNQALQLPI